MSSIRSLKANRRGSGARPEANLFADGIVCCSRWCTPGMGVILYGAQEDGPFRCRRCTVSRGDDFGSVPGGRPRGILGPEEIEYTSKAYHIYQKRNRLPKKKPPVP